MPALRLDFAASAPGGGRLGWGLLVAGLVAALGTGVSYHRLISEARTIEARVDALRKIDPRTSMPVVVDAAVQAQLRKQAESANRVLTALEHPWARLLDAVEAAGIGGIVLLSLDVDADQRSVRLAGQASDRDALSRYLERLGQTVSLGDVRLSQHEWLQRGEEARLRFLIQARWRSSR